MVARMMTMNKENIIALDRRTKISRLDLDCVVSRMVNVYNWPKICAEKTRTQYLRFLYLKAEYGKDNSLPPSLEIDEFWHAHILHTQKYHDDCMAIFGRYLHHQPEHGKSQEELEWMFERETQRLYFLEFGEYINVVYPKLYSKNLIRNIYENLKNVFCKIYQSKSSNLSVSE